MAEKELSLRHSLPTVEGPEEHIFCGGRQQLLPNRMWQNNGCGLIASANLLSYLTSFHRLRDGLFDALNLKKPVPLAQFNRCCKALGRGFLRPIPYGINGISLALGVNLYFWRHHMPYRAKWCMRKAPMWERMERMLRNDLPVIFAVGPNWPLWKKVDMNFYRKRTDGTYYACVKIRAHYITVTAMDETWLQISSWGSVYYINRAEYEDYVNRHSSPMFSNLLLIEKRT